MATSKKGPKKGELKGFTNWADVVTYLRSKEGKKLGISPAEWVEKYPERAKKLNVGLAAGGKVIRTDAKARREELEAERGRPETWRERIARREELGMARAGTQDDDDDDEPDDEPDAPPADEADDEAAAPPDDVDPLEWIRRQVQANIPDSYFENDAERERFIEQVAGAGATSDDEDSFMLAAVRTDWFRGAFPEFETLSQAGVIGILGFGEYRRYKNQVKAAYKRSFGGEMTDAQFQADAERGRSAEHLEFFYDYKSRARQMYHQHSQDPNATPEDFDAQAEQDFEAGRDIARVEKGLQAVAWSEANRGEVQQMLGRFGGGALSAAELQALGEQQVGLTSSVGLGIQRRVAQASERMSRIFQGETVRGQLALPEATGRDARRGSRVDVGA